MTNIVLAVTILTASWEQFDDAGHLAANGHKFNPKAMTCATRAYPIGTKLLVTDTHNGNFVLVTVTDKPAKKYGNRIDLSPKAFEQLNGLALGVCEVKVSQLGH